MRIKHTFTAVNDVAIVGEEEWNADHAIADPVDGGLLIGDTLADAGAEWLAPGGLGSLLMGAGATAPAWLNPGAPGSLMIVNPSATPGWLAPGGAGQLLVGGAAPSWLAAGGLGALLVGGGPAAPPAWLAPGAAGAVLVSAGPAAPAFTRTPSLDTLTLSATAGALIVHGSDAPTNYVIELRGTAAGFGFKDDAAVPTKSFGYIIGGGVDALGVGGPAVNVLRIGGNAPLILNENGGPTVLGGPLSFGGVDVAKPSLRRSGSEVRFRTANDMDFVGARLTDLFCNQAPNTGGNGALLVGGMAADRSWGGIWNGAAAAAPSFSNYAFLCNNNGSAASVLFNNAFATGTVEFRIVNNSRLIVGQNGVGINQQAAAGSPPHPLRVHERAGSSTVLFQITDTGAISVKPGGLGAFVAGDKYVTIDSAGNLHVSATGPAS